MALSMLNPSQKAAHKSLIRMCIFIISLAIISAVFAGCSERASSAPSETGEAKIYNTDGVSNLDVDRASLAALEEDRALSLDTDVQGLTEKEIEELISKYRHINAFMVSGSCCLSNTWDEGAVFYYPDYYKSHYYVENEVCHLYFPVTNKALDEWQEVESYVKSTYTPQSADKLISEQDYLINFNGRTYTLDGSGYSTFESDEFTYEVTDEHDDSATVVCTIVSEPHDPEDIGDDFILTITFSLKRTKDGWRIDSVETSRQDTAVPDYDIAKNKLLERIAERSGAHIVNLDEVYLDEEDALRETEVFCIRERQNCTSQENGYSFTFRYNENMEDMKDRLAADYIVSRDTDRILWYDPANDWYVDIDDIATYDISTGDWTD